MTSTITDERKVALEKLVRFAQEVIPFSAAFDWFIRETLPEHKGLIETLATHEFTAGHLETVYHGLEREVCSLDALIAAAKDHRLEELATKAFLAKAIGILALRSHDVEWEAPIL